MHTAHRPRTVATRAHRGPRRHRVLRPMAGQAFEITIHQVASQWIVHIPEIDGTCEVSTRASVELAARERIADSTGIPLGYISVWVRD